MAGEHRLALALLAAVAAGWIALTALAASRAALPDSASGIVLAAFPRHLDDTAVFAALTAAGGRPLRRTWIDGSGVVRVWVVAGESEGFVGRLKALGALAAFGDIPVVGPVLAGCFAVSGDADIPKRYRIGP